MTLCTLGLGESLEDARQTNIPSVHSAEVSLKEATGAHQMLSDYKDRLTELVQFGRLISSFEHQPLQFNGSNSPNYNELPITRWQTSEGPTQYFVYDMFTTRRYTGNLVSYVYLTRCDLVI